MSRAKHISTRDPCIRVQKSYSYASELAEARLQKTEKFGNRWPIGPTVNKTSPVKAFM